MSRQERAFWYLLTGAIATAVLACIPFLPWQNSIEWDPWNVNQNMRFLPVLCFPLAIILVSLLRLRLVKANSLEFVIVSFVCYQVLTFTGLLCVLFGVEPFIWVAARGASLGMSSVSFVFQVLALIWAVAVVAAISAVNKWKFPPTTGKRRFIALCAVTFLLGLVFNFIWFVLPPYEEINDYFGNMADWHIMQNYEYAKTKAGFKNSGPDSPNYVNQCMSMMWVTNRLAYREPSKIAEVRTIGKIALEKCTKPADREKIYDTLSYCDRENALEYRAKQLTVLEGLGKEKDWARACCLEQIGELQVPLNRSKAIEYFTKAADLRKQIGKQPESVLWTAGLAFKRNGNYEEAEKYFTRLSLVPLNEHNRGIKRYGNLNLAECFYRKGKIASASPYMEKYFEENDFYDSDSNNILEMAHNPAIVNSWPRIGRLRVAKTMVYRDRFQQAYPLFLQLYSTAPNNQLGEVERHICAEGIGLSLYGLGRLSEAIPYFKEAEATMPKSRQTSPYSEFSDFLQTYAELKRKVKSSN
ncbi:MAG: hypothetical protein K2Y22_06980 [Candidatus Obscuribacterales bacterium]|nr:hypothetical protein [Candidatus Obscuribacterales bacterium]